MTQFKLRKVFAKQTSLQSKIMGPFVTVIALMTVLFLAISIYSLSDIFKRSTLSMIEEESLMIGKSFESIKSEMIFATHILPKLNATPESVVPYASAKTMSTPFNWKRLRFYSPDKQDAQHKLLSEKLTNLSQKGESQIYPFFNITGSDIDIKLIGVSQGGSSTPYLIEYPLDTQTLKTIQGSVKSQIALIYIGKTQAENRAEVITTSKIITSLPALNRHLKNLAESLREKKENSLTTRVKIGTTTYSIHIQRTTLSPNLYFAALRSSNEALHAKIKILLITLVMLALIGGLVFAIYAIIIRKITSSIDILTSVSEKIAKGDLDQQVFLDTSDEIGELSSIFNQMVTNLKLSSENLRVEKERSEAIISCIPEGIIVTDLENRLILANHRAEDMFNFSLNQVQGKFILEYIHNEDLITALNEKMLDNKKPITREVQIPGKGSENQIFSLMSSFVENNQGEPIGVITILKDQTHERQVEELKDGFLRTVSHELRTPLTSVIGFIELVRSGINISEEQRRFLGTALNEASNLKRLIDDLLDLSQIKAGKMKMQKEEIHIKDLLENLISTLKPLGKGKNLKLSCEIKNESLHIVADPTKLRRILVNLFSNAIKFTQEGFVKVSCIAKDTGVLFAIEDTGIGLREEEKEVIFEKFRQIDYSSRREYDGIGLGLSIVRQLVEMHNGKIWVDSTYGKGSVFYFTIETPIV